MAWCSKSSLHENKKSCIIILGACQVKADLLLLVDGSNSIQRSGLKETGDADYYRNFILNGLKFLVSQFNVNRNEVHISILFFGDNNIKSTSKEVSSFSISGLAHPFY